VIRFIRERGCSDRRDVGHHAGQRMPGWRGCAWGGDPGKPGDAVFPGSSENSESGILIPRRS
jgi:hypothetical protein